MTRASAVQARHVHDCLIGLRPMQGSEVQGQDKDS